MQTNELRIFIEMLKLLMENEELKKRIEELEGEKRYLEELVDGDSGSGWIPCSEKMPESGLTVHVFAVGEDFEYQFDAYVASSGTWYTFDDSTQEGYATHAVSHELKITHWMPLEEPPKGV